MAHVEIFTSPYCPYCISAKELFRKKGVSFDETDVSQDDSLRDAMVKRAGGRRTVPQIFIDDRHIGGCDDLYALDAAGGLDPLLGARA